MFDIPRLTPQTQPLAVSAPLYPCYHQSLWNPTFQPTLEEAAEAKAAATNAASEIGRLTLGERTSVSDRVPFRAAEAHTTCTEAAPTIIKSSNKARVRIWPTSNTINVSPLLTTPRVSGSVCLDWWTWSLRKRFVDRWRNSNRTRRRISMNNLVCKKPLYYWYVSRNVLYCIKVLPFGLMFGISISNE